MTMFRLFAVDSMGEEIKPFATVATGDEAENEARQEILEGDAAVVKVEGVGYLAVADLPYTCTACECEPGNCGAGAMVWYANIDWHDEDEAPKPYCSYECVTAEVKA